MLKNIWSCETDDGGPLVEIFNGVSLLYGLIDMRESGYCSKIITNRLGTYVDISKFYDWIEEHKKSSAQCATLSYFLISFSIIIKFIFKIWKPDVYHDFIILKIL